MTDSRPRGPDERHPTTDRGEHVPAAIFTTHPFLCRCADCRRAQPVPYLYRPETDDEIARHVRLLRQREQLSGVRHE